ncbi:MAG: outer membrane protein assembly factor [Paludibacterium sp.]|uniref:autotransporter assembly complex protein TamA n=1 Tax=Paludibacterium sp. TaxID=1917523 RepID=UPI0025D0190B|nr:autotransporter assembly complex family protein [Paludibacterium sp.]MBV8045831.1 outer membrane protein assembly factor [Paludibacterium sp.]MBV8647613.1 outer membrane protein assembly factor [Paludibacterium sp.]
MTFSSLFARLGGLLLFGLSSYSLAADYAVRFDAPPALATVLGDHLPLATARLEAPVSDSDLEVLVRSTPESARKLLETEGYFDARVQVRDEGGSPRQFLVQVEPGMPVTIGAVDLQLKGPLAEESDVAARRQAIMAQWPLPVGAVFRQASWDVAKRQALQAVAADRFPLARLETSQAVIDPVDHNARLTVVIDSGPLVRFGALEIHGLSRYPLSVVQKLADFKPGDPYRLQVLQDYQAALEHSNQFSGAVVSADLQHVAADNTAPVIVELSEFPLKKLELGLTYDTDVGPGVRVGFDHNNLFGTGLTGSSVLSWDQSQQSLNFGIALPRTADGYVHTVNAVIKRTDIQNLITQSEEIGVWRIHTLGSDEWRIGLNFVRESQHVVDEDSQVNRALLPSVGVTRRAVDNPLHPRSGYLIDGMLSGTVDNGLSSTNFVRLYARAAQYWTPFSSAFGTLMARLEGGRVWASNVADVPNSQLFRAGGTNSVRGYDYQSLGLPGPNGSVLGGAVLVTGTLEYQIPVYKDWALALFTDAGNAVADWQSFSLKRSYGIGARWYSPVAPLSFDLAKPQGQGGVAWGMSLGLAF